MGAKIPQRSSSRSWLRPAVAIYPKVTLWRRTEPRSRRSQHSVCADIQLAVSCLASSHQNFSFPGPLLRTICELNIAQSSPSVNPAEEK